MPNDTVREFYSPSSFPLECGSQLTELRLAYHSYGTLNAEGDNVIWVCHALTASSEVDDWWQGLFGPGKILDPQRYFIVCANMLGSCYGSTTALSTDPKTGAPYYHDFPLISNRDIVNAFELLREHLGIKHIRLITGGSMGGQQALEWLIMQPSLFSYAVPMATNALHSPWGIAFNESQRMALAADPSWKTNTPDAGWQGLQAARAVAMLSYRSYETYQRTQAETNIDLLDDYSASSYQRYQGLKLAKRFDAFSYWALSKAMDSHHVGRNRGGASKALSLIQAKTMVIAIDSDVLFPKSEQQFLAAHIPGAHYQEISSIYGHDGFLVETGMINSFMQDFMARN